MPIAGGWLTANRARDPQQAILHEVDAEHSTPGALDENVTWHGQPYQETAPAPAIVGDEWVTHAPGVMLDRTPDTHEDGGPRGIAGPAELAAGHSVDYGADERESRDFPPFLFAGDRYDSTADEGLGPQGVAPVALLRGLTSDPANNPPLASYLGQPYRFGWYRRTWSEHDFSPPDRVHTYRIIRPNTVTVVGDAPPPGDAGPYSSPFSSLARAIRTITAKPAIRRVPEPLDAGVVDDGLDQDYIEPASDVWVTG